MNERDMPLSRVESLVRAHVGTTDQRGAAPEEKLPSPCAGFTITISREVGALGNGVATEVGRRLGWAVYDKEILDKVAAEVRRPPAHLRAVDERPGSWLEEAVCGLLGAPHVDTDVYLKSLITTVRSLAVLGRSVIVGRGANFILSPDTTLRIRLVASPEDRVKVIARRLGLSPREAAVWMEATERERVEFVKRHFRKDVADALHYDLVLNMSRLSIDEAADVIIGVLRRAAGPNLLVGRDAISPIATVEQETSALT